MEMHISSSHQSQQLQDICSKLGLQELQGQCWQCLQQVILAPAAVLGMLFCNLINGHTGSLWSEKEEKGQALLDSFSCLKA